MLASVGSCIGALMTFLLCGCFKAISNGIVSRSARAGYCIIYLISMLLAWLLKDYAKSFANLIPGVDVDELSNQSWYGNEAVYRLTFGVSIFYGSLSLVMIGVKYKNDKRDKYLQHGSWGVKFIIWLLCVIFPYFLPGDFHWYAWIARISSSVYLIIQMIILLDFICTLNDVWFKKGQDNKCYLYMLLVVVCTMYILSALIITCGFIFFNPKEGKPCTFNITFLIWTIIAIIVFSLLAIHEAIPHGSLFPASVISMYCSYLCYSALQSEPLNYQCNGLTVISGSGSTFGGVLLTLGVVIYSALRAGSNTDTFQICHSSDSEMGNEQLLNKDIESKSEISTSEEQILEKQNLSKEAIDEYTPVTYNYSFFHMIFTLASLYCAMLMTNWGTQDDNSTSLDVSWTSVYVKIVSQILTIGLYVWTLVAPVVFPNRDFS